MSHYFIFFLPNGSTSSSAPDVRVRLFSLFKSLIYFLFTRWQHLSRRLQHIHQLHHLHLLSEPDYLLYLNLWFTFYFPDGSTSPDDSNTSASYIICAWCQKAGPKLFTLKTPTLTKAFCSEYCFTQCRRASFKKNKVCDWCKHVRHTVNYVDFQVSPAQDVPSTF